MPKWQAVPLARIDHTSVQQWITALGEGLAPATVAQCHRIMSAVMRAAVWDRLIAASPCEGIRLPKLRRTAEGGQTVSRLEFAVLLPQVPHRWRALVAVAGGTGLRWGECVGLRWDVVDLDRATVTVIRVAVEVAGHVTDKAYPKSRAGRRTVPLPPFAVEQLRAHRKHYDPGPSGQVFTNEVGGPPRRTLFRARVWRPSLVRAELLGSVQQVGPRAWRASWTTAEGRIESIECFTRTSAVAAVARSASGGLRFHDLRHSYATWLVSDGVPINDVQRVMGHEQASTTLNMYTHAASETDTRRRVLGAFAASSLPSEAQQEPAAEEEGEADAV